MATRRYKVPVPQNISARYASDLVRDEGFWLGIGIVGLLHLYSPERVALGGGVAQALPDFLPHSRAVIAERAMIPFRDVPVVPAELSDNAGVIGAAILVLEDTYMYSSSNEPETRM